MISQDFIRELYNTLPWKVVFKYTSKLCQRMFEWCQDDSFCDVTLKLADGSRFAVHRVILAAASPYFHTLFTTNFSDSKAAVYNISNFSASLMSCILKYFYTGDIMITDDNIAELLYAADFLLVEPLKKLCRRFLFRNLEGNNFLRYHYFIKQYFNRTRKSEFIRSLKIIPYGMFDDPFLLELPYSQIKDLLQNDAVKRVREKDLVNFIVQWSECDTEEDRKNHIPDLLAFVSLDFIPINCLPRLIQMTSPNCQIHMKMSQVLRDRTKSESESLIYFISSRASSAACCCYIPSLDHFVSVASLPINSCGCALKTAVLNGVLYVICYTDKALCRKMRVKHSSMMSYHPTINQWFLLPSPIYDLDDTVEFDGAVILAGEDALYFVHLVQRRVTLMKFTPGDLTWKVLLKNHEVVRTTSLQSPALAKVENNVLVYVVKYSASSEYFLVMTVDLKSLCSTCCMVEQHFDPFTSSEIRNRLAALSWSFRHNFDLDESYSLHIPSTNPLRSFQIVNAYEETVCNVDLNRKCLTTCRTLKYHELKYRGFKYRNFPCHFQGINCDGRVFMMSTKDRSCAMYDLSIGFFKYVEQNPVFPARRTRKFNLSKLEIPAEIANKLFPSKICL